MNEGAAGLWEKKGRLDIPVSAGPGSKMYSNASSHYAEKAMDESR